MDGERVPPRRSIELLTCPCGFRSNAEAFEFYTDIRLQLKVLLDSRPELREQVGMISVVQTEPLPPPDLPPTWKVRHPCPKRHVRELFPSDIRTLIEEMNL